jgi:hypothetical protein
MLVLQVASATSSIVQAILTPFWQTIKDFQSIIGAVIGFVLSGLLMLFITRLVNSRGKFLFLPINREWTYRKESEIHEGIERLTGNNLVTLKTDYDVFNSSNEIRTLRGFRMFFVGGSEKKYIYVKLLASVSKTGVVKLLPKDTERISFEVMVGGVLIEEVKRYDPKLILQFMSERSKKRRIEVEG